MKVFSLLISTVRFSLHFCLRQAGRENNHIILNERDDMRTNFGMLWVESWVNLMSDP